jgi:hypothetical protein
VQFTSLKKNYFTVAVIKKIVSTQSLFESATGLKLSRILRKDSNKYYKNIN